MTYLQRLLATAPSPAAGPAPAGAPGAGGMQPLAPASGPATSPIIAADQRLALFPGLLDAARPDAGPAAPGPENTARPAPVTPDPAARERAADGTATGDAVRDITRRAGASGRAGPEARVAPWPVTEAQGPPPAAAPTAGPRSHERSSAAAGTAPPAVSPWQRVVEQAPLDPPAPPATPADRNRPQADAAIGPPDPAAPSHRREPPAPVPTREPGRAPAEAAPPPAQPHTANTPVPDHPSQVWPIPADALQPHEGPVAASPIALSPEPAREIPERRIAVAATPTQSTSPLARPGLEMLAPVAPPRASATAGEPVRVESEVRIVERIREVAADPPPPRMTAADASVIGPLGRRGRRPRQTKFGLSR